MQTWCIDRITDKWAVCERENEEMEQIPLMQLPEGVQEGDVLIRAADGGFTVDYEETQRRRAEIRAMEQELFRDRD